jgi:hypothetical protein
MSAKCRKAQPENVTHFLVGYIALIGYLRLECHGVDFVGVPDEIGDGVWAWPDT